MIGEEDIVYGFSCHLIARMSHEINTVTSQQNNVQSNMQMNKYAALMNHPNVNLPISMYKCQSSEYSRAQTTECTELLDMVYNR